MKQEEKAKAYDEALAKAKEQYNYPCMRSCMGILEEIFPELKESEDEKVRKELIKHLKEGAEGYEPAGGSSDYQRWLAWLEKQKAIDVLDEEERKFANDIDSYRKEIDTAYQKGYNEGVKVTLEKQSRNPYSGVSFEYNGNIWGMCARDNGVDILCDKHLIKHLEKQGEERKITHEEICKSYGIPDIGEFSDGYHTFNGLYKQRMILFAVLVKTYKDMAWKSWKHEDGLDCFGGGWFIVGIDTPAGTYTYHYEAKDWDRFDCQILEKAKHWDGHDESDVERLFSLVSNANKDKVVEPNA